MFKWVEIGLEVNKNRYETLSRFMIENQFQNEVHFLTTNSDDFSKNLNEVLKNFDGVRIGRGCGEMVLSSIHTQAALVQKIKAADAVVKANGTWWLRANAVDGFFRILNQVGEKLDLESHVLVVGVGAAARVAVTSLFMLGFKNFSISNIDVGKATEAVKDLQKSHMGAHFKIVAKDRLISLPGLYGVLVNTTPLVAENPMLAELYYFNFFKTGGVAIDFSISPIETPLLRAAKDVGALCIYGYQISAITDMIWAEQVAGRAFAENVYLDLLREALDDSEPNVSKKPD